MVGKVNAQEDVSWLRRQRWWLLGLPIALVLSLLSASYRVNDFWYENGWHRLVASVPQGRFLTTKHTVYSFDDRPKSVGLRLRLRDVSKTDAMYNGLGEPQPLPPGMVGVEVTLDFRAVRGKPAPYCTVYVVDRDGNRYEVEELDGGSNPCPPPGGTPDDPTAPAAWTRTVAAPVPKSAVLTDVWVGVSWPGYVRLHLTKPRRAGTLEED